MAKAGISKIAPIGKRFGKLTVSSLSRPSQNSGSSQVDCLCECGDLRPYYIGNLAKMLDPMCPSCKPSARPSKGRHQHPLFATWKGIIQRCENPNHTHYSDYGARGIQLCPKWRSDFEAFAADMGERPAGHSIDRINPDGPYAPDNCRWATAKTQLNNRRDTIKIEWRGQEITATEACEIAGISKALLLWRVKRGWPIEKTMTTPAGAKRNA